eukprot:8137816-Pyramimonas_sp.AAC.1
MPLTPRSDWKARVLGLRREAGEDVTKTETAARVDQSKGGPSSRSAPAASEAAIVLDSSSDEEDGGVDGRSRVGVRVDGILAGSNRKRARNELEGLGADGDGVARGQTGRRLEF